jgi:hypothetical protein
MRRFATWALGIVTLLLCFGAARPAEAFFTSRMRKKMYRAFRPFHKIKKIQEIKKIRNIRNGFRDSGARTTRRRVIRRR